MLNNIITEARQWAIKEIDKHGLPSLELFELSNQKGQELAKKFNADREIVMLGTLLMDIKLGEAKNKNKLKEHTKMGGKAVKEFLSNFDIPQEIKNKIINCVEAHHGQKRFICKEAEICANADCYRFIDPKGVLIYFKNQSSRLPLNEAIDSVLLKLEEKHKILTLDYCKKELNPYYKMFKDIFESAKK